MSGRDTTEVLQEVRDKRAYQRKKWGDSHDDEHTVKDFVAYAHDYLAWARMCEANFNLTEAREKLIDAAAICVSAIEMIDRTKRRET